MSSSTSECYGSRNQDTASTMAFSDPYPDSDVLSPGSSHGTVEDFLDHNTCPICEITPEFTIAKFLADKQLVGPEKCLLIDPDNKAHIYCGSCGKFYHVECLMRLHLHMDIYQIANIAVNYMKDLGDNTYHCYKCQVINYHDCVDISIFFYLEMIHFWIKNT